MRRSRCPLDATGRQIVTRFVDAWHRDIPGLAALLADEAILRMPPQRAEFVGRDQIAVVFFATVPAGGRLELIDLVVVAAKRPAGTRGLPARRAG